MPSVASADRPVTVLVNGQAVQSDVPPQIIGGRTMVPLRFVAQALGAAVEWDAASYTATVTRSQPQVLWTAPVTFPPGVAWKEVDVPCAIGSWRGTCDVDTGDDTGGGMTPAVAAAAQVTVSGSTEFTTAGGSAQAVTTTAAVSIGSSAAVQESMEVDVNGGSDVPTIGLQTLFDACPGHLDLDLHSASPSVSCLQ